jgi:hypothetical protein
LKRSFSAFLHPEGFFFFFFFLHSGPMSNGDLTAGSLVAAGSLNGTLELSAPLLKNFSWGFPWRGIPLLFFES